MGASRLINVYEEGGVTMKKLLSIQLQEVSLEELKALSLLNEKLATGCGYFCGGCA